MSLHAARLRPSLHRRLQPLRQRGAALLTALVIVGLVATLAAGMVWQQWRAVQVETAERARVQAFWVLTGALDWARLILREDAKSSKIDYLGEPWATPLAEARLSTFLAVDKDNSDDAPDAFLSGVITDEQSRYNLRNLVNGGAIDPEQLKAFKRLCEFVGVPATTAENVAENLRQAMVAMMVSAVGLSPSDIANAARNGGANAGVDVSVPPIGDNPPLMPMTIDQLSWVGMEPDALEKLRPFITLLPEATPVNLNTAPKEVLAAAIAGLDLASAERLVQARQGNPFQGTEDAIKLLGRGISAEALTGTSVVSNFFSVAGRLRFEDRVVQQRFLVKREGEQVNILHQERSSGIEALAASARQQ